MGRALVQIWSFYVIFALEKLDHFLHFFAFSSPCCTAVKLWSSWRTDFEVRLAVASDNTTATATGCQRVSGNAPIAFCFGKAGYCNYTLFFGFCDGNGHFLYHTRMYMSKHCRIFTYVHRDSCSQLCWIPLEQSEPRPEGPSQRSEDCFHVLKPFDKDRLKKVHLKWETLRGKGVAEANLFFGKMFFFNKILVQKHFFILTILVVS